MSDFSRVIVLVDGSEGAKRAASFAAKLRNALAIPLTLVHVVPMTPEAVMGLSQLDKTDIEKLQRQHADIVLSEVSDMAGGDSEEIEEVLLIGDPAEEILSYVNANPDALVVIGRRGLSPVKSLMLGSVSDKVLRGAVATVTLVN